MNFTDFYFFLQGHAISYSTSNERQKFSGRRGSRIKHLSSTSVVLLSLRIILTRSDRNSPSSWLCPPLMKSLNPLKLLFFLPFVSAEIQKSWINLVLTFDSFSSENFFSTEQFNPLFTSIIYCLYIILSFTLCFNRSTTQWFNTWRRGKLTWYNLVDLISRICHMR